MRFATTVLTSLALLLILVLAVTFHSSHKKKRSTNNQQPAATGHQTAEQGSNAASAQALKKAKSDESETKPTTVTNRFPLARPQSPQNLAIVRANDPLRQKLLKTRLRRDEALLTSEALSNGTELIHLNGTQAHFSAASISADGSIKTTCHNSLEGLANAASESQDSIINPNSKRPLPSAAK